MFLVRMALKNLTRHKRRTLITASVMALGFFVYVVINSMMGGLTQMSFTNIIDLDSGHMKITHKTYWDERMNLPLDNLVKMDLDLVVNIETLPHYLGFAPRLKFMANLNNGVDEIPVTVVGIEPERDKLVFSLNDHLVSGQMFSNGEHKALIGKELANLMELKIGDFLTLVMKTREGSFNTIDAEIAGFLHTGDMNINESTVYVPLDVAQKALNLKDHVSEISIRLDNKKVAATVNQELEQRLKATRSELVSQPWKKFVESVEALSKAQAIETQVMFTIILIIAAVGIINTIILSALERMEEMGMMKAMGMREREIIFIYVVEAIGMGLIGGLIGAVLGAIGVLLLQTIGIDLNWFGAGDINYGMPIMDKFYGVWNIEAFVFCFFFGFIVALITSILPARWAARKDPIEAIYRR